MREKTIVAVLLVLSLVGNVLLAEAAIKTQDAIDLQCFEGWKP